jgi:DNA-binding beta-propeller fold protein YncE
MKLRTPAIASCLGFLLFAMPASARAGAPGYHIIDSVRLGGDTGWDYLAVDTSAERAYISRGTRVQVVDLAARTVIGEIAPTPGVHGIAIDRKGGKGYISNGHDSSVTVFDLNTLARLAVIRIGARNPDAILFEPYTKRVFTFNGGSGNATAVETATGAIAGMIPLGGKPEFAVADGEGRAYVNIEDKSQIVEFDPKSLRVVHTWSVAPGEEPSGLAIDREHHLLYSGCSNKLMVVLDARTGRVVTTIPIGEGVDATAFDHGTGLAFSSNSDGTLTVAGGKMPAFLENAATPRRARTMTVDEKTHLLYTVTAKFGPAPVPTADQPRARPVIEPGSVTLYILGR